MIDPLFDLSGRTAVVSGASRGIGEAIAHLLASHGAHVVCASRKLEGCEEVSLADWERTLAVNLTGQFLCARRAIPMLRASRNASIVNLSSAAGRFGFPMRTPYAASKWAVIGLSRSLSIELGADGIRVNAICPGSVAGARIDSVFANKARARGVSPEQVRAEALAKTSLGQLIEPEDIAHAIVFLASRAGARISGQALGVDADVQALV